MECSARSSRELNRIFESMPETLNDIETLVDNMLEPMPVYQRDIIKRRFVPQIADVNRYIQNLKTICERLKEELDKMLEENVEKIARLKRQVQSLSIEISTKKVYINSLKEEQIRGKMTCDQAKNNLSESKRALSVAENKLDNAKNAQIGVAAGSVPLLVASPLTLFIPIVGPFIALGTAIAGTSMLVSSLTVMEKDIDDKRDYVRGAETEVSRCQNKLVEINKKLSKLNNELEEHTTKMENLNKEEKLRSNFVSTMEAAKRGLATFLSMFNTGFHKLTVVSGRSRSLYSQSQYAYNVDHLKPMLTAFVESFSLFTNTELFKKLNIHRYVRDEQIQMIGSKVQGLRANQRLQVKNDDLV